MQKATGSSGLHGVYTCFCTHVSSRLHWAPHRWGCQGYSSDVDMCLELGASAGQACAVGVCVSVQQLLACRLAWEMRGRSYNNWGGQGYSCLPWGLGLACCPDSVSQCLGY